MVLRGALGLGVFVLFAWLISENRRQVKIRTIVAGVGLQLIIGVLFLKLPVFTDIFIMLNKVILALEQATKDGTSMVFGYLGGGEAPFEITDPSAMFILAFQSLPLVLVMSALSALFFFWKILPTVVRGFSWLLQKIAGLGGAEGVGVSANIFIGMVEAPLLVRPYLQNMTRSEIFTLMTTGMATIAGTVMVLYASILRGTIPNIMGHILTASIISVPAAITMAKVMVPETEDPTAGEFVPEDDAKSAMDAVTRGTFQGMELLLNIIGMLIVLVALVSLINSGLGLLPDVQSGPLTLQRILGCIMAPVVWLMGIPWAEAFTAGSLMGTKTILNELLAYLDLSNLPKDALSSRSMLIMTYAMCGFANPGSLGIMIGGMGTMAPDRRDEIISLGFRSIVAGTLATCMTGAIVGMIKG
ncbi:MAG: nucleoside transporter C-terminal domain-containing protein [Thermodesulfobacteriota bacterium]|nr:nucleoside transporter C-terminal domain-containing protein [Thermodesulfobacteriota bacterium]